MKFLLLSGFYFFIAEISAQVFETDFPDSDINLFQTELAYKAGVTIARADISIKYDNNPIRKINHYKVYDFGQGKLVGTTEVKEYRTRTDSIEESYHRDGNDQIIFIVEKKLGTTSVKHREFSDSRLLSISNYQFKNTKDWHDNLSPKTMIWQENLTYSDSKISVSNQYAVIQKEIILEKDSNEKIVSNSTYNSSGKVSSHHYYKYNGAGLMTSAEEKNFNKYLFDWKKTFEYDDQNRLIRVDYFKEGKLLWFRKITYAKNGLPELDITRNEEIGKLEIRQFKYLVE